VRRSAGAGMFGTSLDFAGIISMKKECVEHERKKEFCFTIPIDGSKRF
jgi:hypothetical protein